MIKLSQAQRYDFSVWVRDNFGVDINSLSTGDFEALLFSYFEALDDLLYSEPDDH